MIEESQEYRQKAVEELQFYKNKLQELLSDNMNIFGNHPPEFAAVSA